jgi:hypothetical protein
VDERAGGTEGDALRQCRDGEVAGVGDERLSTYQLFVFALTLILLAIVIVGMARVPRAIGFLIGLAAVPLLVQSWVVMTEGFAVPLLAGTLSTVA